VGLVITGIGLAVARLDTGAMLTHDFIFEVVLPPLLFEAALCIRWRELRRDLVVVLTLSTLGVVISALVVGAGMMHLLAWPAAPALVFSVLIAATDPIAVIAMFKDTGIKGRLRLLIESERTLTWARAAEDGAITAAVVARALALMAGGGVFVGIAVGWAAIVLAGRTSDHLVDTALTAVAAYGSFLLAEYFHFSGVLATVAAGLLMGKSGRTEGTEAEYSLPGRARLRGRSLGIRGFHCELARFSLDRIEGCQHPVYRTWCDGS
jgi:CPA1 family monovalent cation:H+ antiporter